MPTLTELLAAPAVRPRVCADCARLIDDEVARKRGLMAVPLKAGFKVIKGLRPGFIPHAVDFLLDDFCNALQPFYDEWSRQPPESRAGLEQTLVRDSDRVADALLGVTDRRAQRAKNRVVLKTYQKLRGAAKGHVVDALPGLARAIEPHLAAPAS